MYRGFGLDQFCHQCFSNSQDFGKGKQMPIHYGSQDLNFVTISSTLATQMPQGFNQSFGFHVHGFCMATFFCTFVSSLTPHNGLVTFGQALFFIRVFPFLQLWDLHTHSNGLKTDSLSFATLAREPQAREMLMLLLTSPQLWTVP